MDSCASFTVLYAFSVADPEGGSGGSSDPPPWRPNYFIFMGNAALFSFTAVFQASDSMTASM